MIRFVTKPEIICCAMVLLFGAGKACASWEVLTPGIEYRGIAKTYDNGARKVKLHAVKIQQGKFHIFTHSFHELTQDELTSIKEYRKKHGHLLVLSGGFFYPDFRMPVGLVIENGKTLFPLTPRFSGVVWIKDNIVTLSPSDKFAENKLKPDFAIQGYPRIVDPMNRLGINRHNGKLRHRTALCTVKGYFIMMITDRSYSGLSLYELAKIAHDEKKNGGLECDIAVNLDGGPAPGISVEPKLMALEVREWWQVPNVIVVREK